MKSPLRETPLIATLDSAARWPLVRFKLENLQLTGSFKVRGAWRKLSLLPKGTRVICSSAGNHGAGVAFAGSKLGLETRVVVPESTPDFKRERIERFGADLVVRGAGYDDSELWARELAEAEGLEFVSPFDDDEIIAGNGGQLATEIRKQAPELSMVVCPVGGGGLVSGLAETLAPSGVRVAGVQPETNCAMRDSLVQGRALLSYEGGHTSAGGCEGAVSRRTFEIVRKHAVEISTVSEHAIAEAVGYAEVHLGQRLEPTGAVALAGLLCGALAPAPSGCTVVVLSGASGA